MTTLSSLNITGITTICTHKVVLDNKLGHLDIQLDIHPLEYPALQICKSTIGEVSSEGKVCDTLIGTSATVCTTVQLSTNRTIIGFSAHKFASPVWYFFWLH